MKKRLIALIMAAVMTVGMSVVCFAEPTNEELLAQYYAALEKQQSKSTNKETTANPADAVIADMFCYFDLVDLADSYGYNMIWEIGEGAAGAGYVSKNGKYNVNFVLNDTYYEDEDGSFYLNYLEVTNKNGTKVYVNKKNVTIGEIKAALKKYKNKK